MSFNKYEVARNVVMGAWDVCFVNVNAGLVDYVSIQFAIHERNSDFSSLGISALSNRFEGLNWFLELHLRNTDGKFAAWSLSNNF